MEVNNKLLNESDNFYIERIECIKRVTERKKKEREEFLFEIFEYFKKNSIFHLLGLLFSLSFIFFCISFLKK